MSPAGLVSVASLCSSHVSPLLSLRSIEVRRALLERSLRKLLPSLAAVVLAWIRLLSVAVDASRPAAVVLLMLVWSC